MPPATRARSSAGSRAHPEFPHTGPGVVPARSARAPTAPSATLLDSALARIEAIGRELAALAQGPESTAVLLDELSSNLSEARDAARLLRRRGEAQAEFVAAMSHDLRTPISSILGFTQLAIGSELTAEQRHWLEIVLSRGEVLLRLVDGILDLSKVQAGKLSVAETPFDLRALAHDVVASLAIQAREKRLTLRAHIAPDVPARVLGDSLRLQQVLQNLLGNALKFTPQGDVALIVQRNGPPVDHQSGASLHFEVRDTGIGIAAEQSVSIFEPFTRGSPAPAEDRGGAGLGLAICKRLVESMGGSIWVESAPGAGAAFHFTVRLGLPPQSAPASLLSSGAPTLKGEGPARTTTEPLSLRVLVADDDAASRTLLGILMTRGGHEVVAVANGQQAVEALRAGPFDLVLMDVQMPVMDGCCATRRIRRDERGRPRRTPIVALTAQMMAAQGRRCLAAGMDAYLSKPIDRAALEGVVEAARRKRLAEAQPERP